MERPVHRTVAALLGVALVAGQAACGSSDGDPGRGMATGTPTSTTDGEVTTSASPAEPGSGRIHTLTKPLCEAADSRPLLDLYRSTGDKPLENSPTACGTSLRATDGSRMVVAFSVQAHAARSAESASDGLATSRRTPRFGIPTEIGGAGTAAYYLTDGNKVEVHAYQDNIELIVGLVAIEREDKLPPGIPERMAKVASGTFANLTSGA